MMDLFELRKTVKNNEVEKDFHDELASILNWRDILVETLTRNYEKGNISKSLYELEKARANKNVAVCAMDLFVMHTQSFA